MDYGFQFAWPWLLLALPLPWVVRRRLPPCREEGEAALRVPFLEEWAETGSTAGSHRGALPWWALLAWFLLVLAAARPQWIAPPRELPVSGRDLMLAVDLSGSMTMEDFLVGGERVDRLTALKGVAGRFIQRRQGDRLGLILFGRNAYLQTPLTYDLATVAAMLEESEIGLAGKETAIGDALALAIKHLLERPNPSRAVILLSDGSSNAGAMDPRQAARLAVDQGIRIYTIGVGSDQPIPISTPLGIRHINPASELDEETLRELAATTGGRYFRAADTAALEEIYRELDRLEPTVDLSRMALQQEELFPLLLALALLCSVLALRRWAGAPPPAREFRELVRQLRERPPSPRQPLPGEGP